MAVLFKMNRRTSTVDFHRRWEKCLLLLTLFISNYLDCACSENTWNLQCATFNSTNGSRHNSLTLEDFTVIGNSADEYSSQGDTYNTTGLWKVTQGCKLKICRNAYLSGACRNFEGSTSAIEYPWLSAKCQCAKKCNCKDVNLRRSICARVYHQAGGCNNCQSSYTELGQGLIDRFADEWRGTVDSVLIRPGCKLIIYEEEDLEGDSISLEGSNELQKLDAAPGSYECECSSDESFKPELRLQDTSDPILINVPYSLDDVTHELKTNPSHPGLLTALRSIGVDRSSRNAYILLLGSSGAGKSSAINILLGQPNVTIAGDQMSTTSEIIELRIPVPLPKLGVRNSQLRIIDTPGLGDTRGLDNDAQFLATLDDFLSNHEELKTKLPNLVLVFHKFADNRRDGVSSKFSKMIRGLNNLKDRITDQRFSNVVFVFSHFCSASNRDQKNPSRLLAEFKNVIEKYSLFPKPIMTVVVENKGKDNFLPMEMGNYLMPNQEYFPKNLIQKLDMITSNLNDAVGNAIIRTAFMSNKGLPEDLLVDSVQHYMVPKAHDKVALYLNSLNMNSFAVSSTEVSTILQQSFNTSESFEHLEYLQRYLNLRNIRMKKDVPQTSLAILDLLKDLPSDNEVYYKMLKIGLGVIAPQFPRNVIAGYGCFNSTLTILSTTPLKMEDYTISSSGFMIPNVIECQKQSEKDVNVKKEIICKDEPRCIHKHTLTFKLFQFKLRADSEASVDFVNRVDSLLPFDQHDYDNVEKWNKIFNDFGTHVVATATVGGRIEVQFKVLNGTRNEAIIKKFQQDVVDFILGKNLALQRSSNDEQGGTCSFMFHGGDPAYHLSDMSMLTLDQFRVTIKNWKKSLNFYPVAFAEQVKPMSLYFQRTWSTETYQKVADALSHFRNSTLRYVSPPPPTPDPKVVEEFERQKKEQEERIKQIEMEMKKAKEEEERKKRQAAEELTRRQNEAKRKELERQRQQEEAEKERLRKEEERIEAERILQYNRILQDALDQIKHQIELYEIQRREEEERERIRRIMSQQAIYVHRDSCLKKGSRILLADFTEKPVESVQIGDVLLDMDLKPTRVLGMSYEFLLDQKFYGFDNHNFFFTDTHMFVGLNQKNETQLYTTSTERLFGQNPLLEYLNVRKFEANQTNILKWNGDRNTVPKGMPVQIHQDPQYYDPTTLIYFLQVDSPTGTYIVEGFVSRHEVPPMDKWPNTMPVLLSLLYSTGMGEIAEMTYRIEAISLIDNISENVKSTVLKVLGDKMEFKNSTFRSQNETKICRKLATSDFDVNEAISKVYSNPMVAAMGMELYGRSGRVIAMVLDNDILNMNDCNIARLQKSLIHAMEKEVRSSLMELRNNIH